MTLSAILAYLSSVQLNIQSFQGSANNKFFLTKRHDDSSWELPGGWAEVGEGPREALQREIEEETSLSIEAGPLIEVFHRLPDSTG